MPKPTQENKQVKAAPKTLTVDERALKMATEQATEELRSGCVWVTYCGRKPELAQPSVTVPAPGRNLRFFKDVRKAVPQKLAEQLTKSNAAFKMEG